MYSQRKGIEKRGKVSGPDLQNSELLLANTCHKTWNESEEPSGWSQTGEE